MTRTNPFLFPPLQSSASLPQLLGQLDLELCKTIPKSSRCGATRSDTSHGPFYPWLASRNPKAPPHHLDVDPHQPDARRAAQVCASRVRSPCPITTRSATTATIGRAGQQRPRSHLISTQTPTPAAAAAAPATATSHRGTHAPVPEARHTVTRSLAGQEHSTEMGPGRSVGVKGPVGTKSGTDEPGGRRRSGGSMSGGVDRMGLAKWVDTYILLYIYISVV